MKKIAIICLLFISQLCVHAQDVIIRKDGSELQVKVLEISETNVKYIRVDNIEGPVYNENKNRILKIKYANGTEDVMVKNVMVKDDIVKDIAVNDYSAVQINRKPKKRVRYSGLVEAAPFSGLDLEVEDLALGFSLTTVHGIQIKDRYFVGMGIGVNFELISDYQDITVPLFMTFRCYFSDAAARPFFSVSLGAQFGSSDSNNYNSSNYYGDTYATVGLWSNVMFGYHFKNKFYLAAGFTLQNSIAYDYDDSDYYWDSQKIYEAIAFTAAFGVKF